MSIMAMVKSTTMVKCNGTKYITNICTTPNGTQVARIGSFYYKVNSDNIVTSTKKWYIGTDRQYNVLYELWQYEKMETNGYRIVTVRKAIVL